MGRSCLRGRFADLSLDRGCWRQTAIRVSRADRSEQAMSTRGVQTGHGYKFGGAKAKAIKARLRAMKEERERTGRVSMFDAAHSHPDVVSG
jgi:hypothetical protein